MAFIKERNLKIMLSLDYSLNIGKEKLKCFAEFSGQKSFSKQTDFKYVSAKIYLLEGKIETLEKTVKFVQI